MISDKLDIGINSIFASEANASSENSGQMSLKIFDVMNWKFKNISGRHKAANDQDVEDGKCWIDSLGLQEHRIIIDPHKPTKRPIK